MGPTPGIVRRSVYAGSRSARGVQAASSAVMRPWTAVTWAPRSVQAVGQPERQPPLRHRRAPGRRGLPGLQHGGELGPEAVRQRLAHRPEGRTQGRTPARLAARQLGAGPPEALHQGAELRERAIGLTVEENLALFEEVGAVGRVLPVMLVPGPVLGPSVPVRHAAGDQDDGRPLGVEEGRHRLVVGPRGLEAADHLAAPRGALGSGDRRPELGEAPAGVRDGERGPHDPGVGVPHLHHVLRLRHVEPHEEPGPVGPQGRLQLPKPLDTLGIVTHRCHGVFPPLW